MAYSFPLTLTEFFNGLVVKETQLWLPPTVEVGDETGGGEIITASMGAPLWEGEVTVASDSVHESDKAFALMNLLMGAGASFFIRPRHRIGTTLDNTAAALTGLVLEAVNANMRDIRIANFPAGYALFGVGSYLSFTYDTTRRAFHQVVSTQNADGTGDITCEVVPPVRPGYVLGAAVAVRNPILKAVLQRDTVRPPRQLPGSVATGFSFGWRQTLGK